MSPDEREIIVVYVTAPEAEAPRMARALVDRGLVACVNIVPGVRSFFHWNGAVHDDAESLMLVKTTADRFEKLCDAVVELHSYQIAEVIAVPVVAANAPYRAWVIETVDRRNDGEHT